MTLTLEDNGIKSTITDNNPDIDSIIRAFIAALVAVGYSEDFVLQTLQDFVGV